ncbi:MAG: hypothetical protein U0942_03480 [Parvibaculum sp.]|uniref:hypothetical protein n=1 Tax=Parvibaculum sp. TaxID=2024848 RepID=UPI002AB882A0|nr:hypothetical protein [Parvibaculum sp.]MDZ4380384.1 hypothetical protein [Parvibaculum sp.]
MSGSAELLTPEAAENLVQRLSQLANVGQFDQPGEPQASTLAHSFADLETSFREILYSLLPKLLDEKVTRDELNEVLLDIGEEFRHILYHIKDPAFYGYLQD